MISSFAEEGAGKHTVFTINLQMETMRQSAVTEYVRTRLTGKFMFPIVLRR